MHVRLLTSIPSLHDAILSASEGFGQPIDQALSLDVAQHLDACGFGFQFLTDENEIAGFTLFKHYGSLLYGGGMMIRPAFQKSGLVRRASCSRRNTPTPATSPSAPSRRGCGPPAVA